MSNCGWSKPDANNRGRDQLTRLPPRKAGWLSLPRRQGMLPEKHSGPGQAGATAAQPIGAKVNPEGWRQLVRRGPDKQMALQHHAEGGPLWGRIKMKWLWERDQNWPDGRLFFDRCGTGA